MRRPSHSPVFIPITAPTSTLKAPRQTRQKRRRDNIQRSLFPSPPASTPEKASRSKRRRTESDPSQLRPHKFWDTLTRVPLCKSALRELDQRNAVIDLAVTTPTPTPTPTPKQADLDRPQLLRYARHGGPELSDIRGLAEMPRRRGRGGGRGRIQKSQGRPASRRSATTQTKSSSPYDAAFRQHLIDWKVWPINYVFQAGHPAPPPPDNLQDIIKEVCSDGRGSLEPGSFNVKEHENFQLAHSLNGEEESRSRTLDLIEGPLALSTAHVKKGPVKLSNLRPLLPANLVPGCPDRIYGARLDNLDKSVRDRLDELIIPTAHRDILCPNFVVHIKGEDGTLQVAERQAVYDGALVARGMDYLWEAGSSHDQDHQYHARTITCTFADGVLRMYAMARHRFGAGSNQDVEYVTHRLGSWLMVEELDQYCRGAAAFRNGLEWARRQREEAISRANTIATRGASSSSRPPSSAWPESPNSEYQSSADPIT
ncbi:hypothetical protein DHEL01_v207954 [Diaporthe helianthi]|uniref:Uncharacterized protein n=1 Tax=Diaporthe helianthi TaxID=158607 RepID=A0A2P5HTV3_DIAHE|nr:hypothetical protein DHEL01_v207954 [Diaporthe helianthi]